MGIQFERVTHAAEASLTWVVDDLQDRRQLAKSSSGELEAWLNAVHRQAIPLVSSSTGRADLEAWLAMVDEAATP